MSSPISTTPRAATGQAGRAVLRARIATLMSWVAVFAGLGFVGAFLYQAGLFASLSPDEPTVAPEVENPEQITSYDSTITGIDKDNQPYKVTARRGWQDKDLPQIIHLEEVDGQFRRQSGDIFDVTSKTARYDDKLKELDLMGGVVVNQAGGFELRTERAHAVMRTKTLTSDAPVEVKLDSGTISANGLQITDDGANILFLNGVKAHFEAAPAKGDPSP